MTSSIQILKWLSHRTVDGQFPMDAQAGTIRVPCLWRKLRSGSATLCPKKNFEKFFRGVLISFYNLPTEFLRTKPSQKMIFSISTFKDTSCLDTTILLKLATCTFVNSQSLIRLERAQSSNYIISIIMSAGFVAGISNTK